MAMEGTGAKLARGKYQSSALYIIPAYQDMKGPHVLLTLGPPADYYHSNIRSFRSRVEIISHNAGTTKWLAVSGTLVA